MSDLNTLISLRGLEKSYPHGPGRTFVLRQITLDVKDGEYSLDYGTVMSGQVHLATHLGDARYRVGG